MEQELAKIEALITTRDIKKAEAAIAKLLRTNPSKAIVAKLLQQRAQVRLIAARIEDAISDLTELETLDEQAFATPEVLALLADCQLARFETATLGFADKQDVQSAQGLYQGIIEEFPNYENLGWLFYQNGRALLIEDRATEAEASFHKALLAPSQIKALAAYCYERLAFITFYEMRQAQQALVYLDKAIASYPSGESPFWLVQVYLLRSRVLKDKHCDEAISAAEKALRLAGDNRALVAETCFALAELLCLQTGNENAIITYVQRFMQNAKAPLGVDLSWSRAYEMLADAYMETGDYEAAIMAYHNALHINPYHPWEETIHYRIAYAHYQQQAFASVVETLQNSLSQAKGLEDYRIYNLLGNALFALGQYPEAANNYEKSLELAPQGVDVQTMQAYYSLALNPPL